MKKFVKLCLHSFLFDDIFFTENSKFVVDLSFFVYFRSPTSVIWIIQSKQGISLFKKCNAFFVAPKKQTTFQVMLFCNYYATKTLKDV